MRIMHLITSLKVGGAESSLCNLLENLDHYSNEHIVVYFHEGPNLQRLKDINIKAIKISGVLSPYDPIGIWRLVGLTREYLPDAIHSALWSANILGSFVSKLLGIPILCDLHGDVRDYGKLRFFIEQATTSIPHKFVAVSSSVEDAFISAYGDEAKGRCLLIPNGIDIAKTKERSREGGLRRFDFGFDSKDFVVGSIGRLEPVKSYGTLIRAISKISDKRIKLCLIGDGSQRQMLEDLVEELGCKDRVLFMGQRSDAVRFYQIFDCFALSSISEGMSIALLEALACGIPIITTSKEKKHGVITNREHGFVVSVGDIESFCQAIMTLYSDEYLKSRMSEKCASLAQNSFDIRRMVESYELLYRGIGRG